MAKLYTLSNGQRAKVTIESLFVPRDELQQEVIDAIRNATRNSCLRLAMDLWGSKQRVTARDLVASDMSYTNCVFTETSNATANAWNAMAFGPFTVADATIIGIYGLKVVYVLNSTILRSPITGVRLEVGGARIAQWHVQGIDYSANGATSTPYRAYAGFSKSPVIAQEKMPMTCYEYTRTASTAYDPCWLGVVVEKEGLTLRP